jgi:hypothetical protein
MEAGQRPGVKSRTYQYPPLLPRTKVVPPEIEEARDEVAALSCGTLHAHQLSRRGTEIELAMIEGRMAIRVASFFFLRAVSVLPDVPSVLSFNNRGFHATMP